MAQPTLYRIVYISKASHDLRPADMAAIADVARTRNAGDGVTGLLLYDGARFIQAIEGREAAVRETMRRIAHDHRHMAIAYLQQGPIDAREFGDWSMTVRDAAVDGGTVGFLDRVKADVLSVGDAHLRAAFIGFAVLCTQRALARHAVGASA